jgi:hypothetical protein
MLQLFHQTHPGKTVWSEAVWLQFTSKRHLSLPSATKTPFEWYMTLNWYQLELPDVPLTSISVWIIQFVPLYRHPWLQNLHLEMQYRNEQHQKYRNVLHYGSSISFNTFYQLLLTGNINNTNSIQQHNIQHGIDL